MNHFKALFFAFSLVALLAASVAAQTARTFYFLPPSEDKWIAGNSYLYDVDSSKSTLMSIDTTRCGWFRMAFTTENDIPEKVLIYLGPQGIDKLDSTGKGADVNNQAWIALRAKFGNSATLYLIADGMRFTTANPGDQNEVQNSRCSYKIAAFIYDTDNSVNGSFKGTYSDPGTANNGIRRGIVDPILDSVLKKPTFAAPSIPYANWLDAESFNAAFTPKGLYNGKISNIPRCYDMPFGRAANGTWEFDSDKMRTPTGNNLVGGFYPYILDKAYNLDQDGSPADYSDCPDCNKEYTANCFNNMNTTQLNNLAPVTYKGTTYRGVDAFDRTYFPDGTTHHTYYAQTYGCQNPSPGYSNTTKNTANLSFCFESHGEFTYEKGQEFFFRGDDDIWVFINNRLVIDLGGTHMPAPGFVDLDTIKKPEPLVEGNKYPIDIFFCERLGTQSNVRISTNMYIVQKNTYYGNPSRPQQPMCVTEIVAGDCASRLNDPTGSQPQKYCGKGLVDAGYAVEFYMILRNTTEEIKLSNTASGCDGNNVNDFTCYGGIKVNNAVYTCGGLGQCSGSAAATEKINLKDGNYDVYVRFLKDGAQKASFKIDNINIKTETEPRIVWGNLEDQDGKNPKTLNDAYNLLTKREQFIIADKRTPIYIAGGNWKDNTTYATFVYTNDPDYIRNVKYTIDGTAELEVTNSLGEKVTFPRPLPESGIDTLWVKGSYEIGDKTFEINLSGIRDNPETPSLKLNLYQPKLAFVDSNFAAKIEPSGYIGFGWPFTDEGKPPYVGNELKVYIVAWDSLRNEFCSHCNFILGQTSTTNDDTINKDWGDAIVQGDSLEIKDGKHVINIRGNDAVVDENFATWRVYGPSEGVTYAVWDGLQFRAILVPVPLESYVYDRNGDGIGDSLMIKFDKSFLDEKGNIVDNLLPVLLEVVWEKGNPVYIRFDESHTVENLKNPRYVFDLYEKDSVDFFAKKHNFWKDFIKDSTVMEIAQPNTAFSKDILTFGKGTLSNYTPFFDQGYCVGKCTFTAFRYTAANVPIFDRIPPIVVKAAYTMDKDAKCGSDVGNKCEEKLTVYLSEAVFTDMTNFDLHLIKNPFSYCFEYSQNSKCLPEGESIVARRHDQAWNNLDWQWELPGAEGTRDISASTTYKPSKKSYPQGDKRDSIVDLIYEAYKINANETTHMPKATDWIKIRNDIEVFRDAEGNSFNPREIGVLISGTNYYKKDQVKIAVIGKDATPEDPPLNGVFEGKGNKPTWMSELGTEIAGKDLFQLGSVTEFLPLPKGYPADSAKTNYPGSIGTIFDIANNINIEVYNLLEDECKDILCKTKSGKALTKYTIAEAITMHASVYYHTNLGNYTAHRDPVVGECNSPIFQKENPKDPENNNCYGNEYNLYLAWDLKTNNNRFTGTGAYVAINRFYWQIEYIDSTGNLKTRKFNQDEFIEMFGVRRGK